jgi:hypothetical protein
LARTQEVFGAPSARLVPKRWFVLSAASLPGWDGPVGAAANL